MKFIVFCVGLALAFDQAPTLDPSIPTVSPHENKNPDSCVGQCAFTFIDEIRGGYYARSHVCVTKKPCSQTRKPAFYGKLNYNDFLNSFSNTTFFENFCTIYHTFQQCASKCEPGYLHQLLMRSSEIIDHYCIYKYDAIRQKFPCLAGLQTDTQCVKTCTSHHDAVNSLINNFRHLAMSGDTTRAEQYLGESCEYVTCTLHCDVPAIAHKCDFSTAQLVIDLTQRSFNSMEKMALDTNAVSKWPKQCSDIKTYRLPTPVAPPTSESVIGQSSGHGKIDVQAPIAAALSNISILSSVLMAVFYCLLTRLFV